MTKLKDPLKGNCKLHGKKKSYLYSQVLGGWVCQMCVEQGMFVDLVNDEMLKLYPSRIKMNIDDEKLDPGDWT